MKERPATRAEKDRLAGIITEPPPKPPYTATQVLKDREGAKKSATITWHIIMQNLSDLAAMDMKERVAVVSALTDTELLQMQFRARELLTTIRTEVLVRDCIERIKDRTFIEFKKDLDEAT